MRGCARQITREKLDAKKTSPVQAYLLAVRSEDLQRRNKVPVLAVVVPGVFPKHSMSRSLLSPSRLRQELLVQQKSKLALDSLARKTHVSEEKIIFCVS